MEEFDFNPEDYAIVCQEFSKSSADVTAYEIEAEIKGSLLTCLSLRSRFNPELHYFVTKKENLETCIEILKNPVKSEIPIEEGLMVEL